MKHRTNILNPLARVLAFILGVALLAATASCGKREEDSGGWFRKKEKSVCEAAIDSLEEKFDDLKAMVTGHRKHADQTALWQATTALFIVIAGFAFVGGAALGSRARKEKEKQHEVVL